MRSRSAAAAAPAELAASWLMFASERPGLGGRGGCIAFAPRADGNAVATQLVVERLRVDAEDTRDALLIPAVPLQRPQYVVALHLVEREVRRPIAPGAVSRSAGAGTSGPGRLLGCLCDRRWEVVDGEYLAVGQDREPLDDVSQLPDVARPGILRQAHHGLGGDLESLPPAICVDPEEVLDQEGDVLRSLAQRRHVDLDHSDAVVEVLAKPGSLDLLSEILIGGGDDPDVGLDVPVGADPTELPGLERAQDLDLGGRAHLADLVQEQGALVRGLEEPVLESVSARERAALVTEELALEERVL